MVVRSKNRALELAITVTALITVGCTDDVGDDMLDVRVEIPPDDPDHVVFVGEELVIEPGEDKTFCIHMRADETLALRDVQGFQGEFGHHFVIMSTTEPKPAGTVEDCSGKDMAKQFKPLVIPINDLPDDYGMELPADTPIVLQSHYVNAGDKPLLTRDVIRARKMKAAEVNTWVAPFTSTAFDIEIPNGGETEKTIDCVIEEPRDLLFLGGHMHEWGTAVEIRIGDGEAMDLKYSVDTWLPEFRDAPPVELLVDDPIKLEPGTVVRTTCRWMNNTGEELGFPEEMCVAFGLVANTKQPYSCSDED